MRLVDADALRKKFTGGDEFKSTAEIIYDDIFISVIDKEPTIDPCDWITVNLCEWISVKDKLPEDGDIVVTYSVPNRKISHCECLKSYVTQYGNHAEITHWILLPALPKDN